MIIDYLEHLIDKINVFDVIFFFVMIYNSLQCFVKGFSLSFISFMKWVVSLIITIVLVPKFQPWVSEYIESQFINSIGLGIAVFVCSLFIIIVIYLSRNIVLTMH